MQRLLAHGWIMMPCAFGLTDPISEKMVTAEYAIKGPSLLNNPTISNRLSRLSGVVLSFYHLIFYHPLYFFTSASLECLPTQQHG